jgi:cytochrome c553
MNFRHVMATAASILILAGSAWAEDGKPGDAAAGQAKAAVCGACHGVDGNPNPATPQYPRLAGQHEDYIVRQLELMKSNKRDNAVMAGFVITLTPQDMHDIAAYFAGKTPQPQPAAAPDAKLAALGESYYHSGDGKDGVPACAACHSPDGRGVPGAGFPQITGQFTDYVTLKLKDFRGGKAFGDDDRGKIMLAIAKNLTDDDITALAGYINGLTPTAAPAAK